MFKVVIFAVVSSSFLMAAGPSGSGKSKDSAEKGHASRMVIEKNSRVVIGNEKTVGASPESYTLPAVADDNTIGNAKTVGGSRSYTNASTDGVGKVGNSKTVGNQ